MPFPTHTGSRLTLDRSLEELTRIAAGLKSLSASFRARLAAEITPRVEVHEFAGALAAHRARMQALASTPGLAAFAQQQYDDPELDIIAEYLAMIGALDAVIQNIVTSAPTASPSGALIEATMDVHGIRTPLGYTPSQTATLRGLIDTLLTAID